MGVYLGRFTKLPFLGAVANEGIYPPNQDGSTRMKVVGLDALLEMIDTGHGSIKLPISGGLKQW